MFNRMMPLHDPDHGSLPAAKCSHEFVNARNDRACVRRTEWTAGINEWSAHIDNEQRRVPCDERFDRPPLEWGDFREPAGELAIECLGRYVGFGTVL